MTLQERWSQLGWELMTIDHVIAEWFIVPACDILHRCIGGGLLVAARHSSLPSESMSRLQDTTLPSSLATWSIPSTRSSTRESTSLPTASLSTSSAGSSNTSLVFLSLTSSASLLCSRPVTALDNHQPITVGSSRMWALPSMSTKQFGEDTRTKEDQKEPPSSHGGEFGGVCSGGGILWSLVR